MGTQSDHSETGSLDSTTEGVSQDRKNEVLKHKNEIWTDSLWTTYQESIDFDIVNPANPGGAIRISRKISKGMSVKTDSRTPTRIMNDALKMTLIPLMEEEKETWLNTKAMRKEVIETGKRLIKTLEDVVSSMEDEEAKIQENSPVIIEEGDNVRHSEGDPAQEDSSGDNGVTDNNSTEGDFAF